ncbi:MAG TPA: cytochrome c oxidase assembly protein [Acidimicrobiales bacterium]
MTWWCTASRQPWDWAPRAYPGIWLAMAALLAGYLVACRRVGRGVPSPAVPDGGPPGGPAGGGAIGAASRRQVAAFVAGWAVLWAASDWPLGTLGAGYLASAHMLQYLLTTLVAAPLLVAGVPEPVLRRALARTRTAPLVRAACRPVAAGLLFNLVLVVTHAPVAVDGLRASSLGSFALDAAWLASGLVLWTPVCGPLPELRPSLPVQGVYLFLAAGVVPMVPGGFLTFATTPLYATYELAPRVVGLDAVADQQLAGALMKVGNVPLLWPVLAALFVRWARGAAGRGGPAPPRSTPTGPAPPRSRPVGAAPAQAAPAGPP